jgi:anti-sigma factor ChrR (cupin superfamily)
MMSATPKKREVPPGLASHFVSVAALPWAKTRHAGVETKTLMADTATGVMTVLTKMAAGARLPDHEHVRVEQTYVLEGSLHCGEGICRAGEFVWRPAGSRHEAWAGPEGCLTLAMFQAPNRFYEAGGKVVDFMGNDWEGAWGALQSRKSKVESQK